MFKADKKIIFLKDDKYIIKREVLYETDRDVIGPES